MTLYWNDPHLEMRLYLMNVQLHDIKRIMQLDHTKAHQFISMPDYFGESHRFHIIAKPNEERPERRGSQILGNKM